MNNKITYSRFLGYNKATEQERLTEDETLTLGEIPRGTQAIKEQLQIIKEELVSRRDNEKWGQFYERQEELLREGETYREAEKAARKELNLQGWDPLVFFDTFFENNLRALEEAIQEGDIDLIVKANWHLFYRIQQFFALDWQRPAVNDVKRQNKKAARERENRAAKETDREPTFQKMFEIHRRELREHGKPKAALSKALDQGVSELKLHPADLEDRNHRREKLSKEYQTFLRTHRLNPSE